MGRAIRLGFASILGLVRVISGCDEGAAAGPVSGVGGADTQGSGGRNATSGSAQATGIGGGSSSTGGTTASDSESAGGSSNQAATTSRASLGGTNSTGGTTASSSKSAGGGSNPPATTSGPSLGGTNSTGGTTASSSKSAGGSSNQATTTSGPSLGGTKGNAPIGGASSGGGETASSTDAGEFTLAWEDNFDTFDSKLWQLMTHSWDGNLAQFSTDNASVKDGIVSINLTSQPTDKTKPYRGVEMRSTKTLTYGKISARVRFAKGPGVVSGLVAIYTPWPADDWNELDIEHLGKTPNSSQFNCMVYTGPKKTPPVTDSVSPTQDPLVVDLGFDAEADFHEYDIEWTPAAVRFVVDGKLARAWTSNIALMKLPQNVLFTIWASDSASWAGAIASATVPTAAEMDWIRVYDWKSKTSP